MSEQEINDEGERSSIGFYRGSRRMVCHVKKRSLAEELPHGRHAKRRYHRGSGKFDDVRRRVKPKSRQGVSNDRIESGKQCAEIDVDAEADRRAELEHARDGIF